MDPDTFVVGTLSATNVQPASLVAGAVGDVGVTFIISDPLPTDGKIAHLPVGLPLKQRIGHGDGG